MLKKRISYKDFNGQERNEDFYFHLMESEIIEMELEVDGGFKGLLQKMVMTQDVPNLMKVFKDFIIRSYGEKSPDGKSFMKVGSNGERLVDKFLQSNAYSALFMELATKEGATADFINAITPDKINGESIDVTDPTKIAEIKKEFGIIE